MLFFNLFFLFGVFCVDLRNLMLLPLSFFCLSLFFEVFRIDLKDLILLLL